MPRHMSRYPLSKLFWAEIPTQYNGCNYSHLVLVPLYEGQRAPKGLYIVFNQGLASLVRLQTKQTLPHPAYRVLELCQVF